MKDKLNEILRNVMHKITTKEFDLELLNGWENAGNLDGIAKAMIKDGEMVVTGQIRATTDTATAANTPIFKFPNGYMTTHNCYGTLRAFNKPAAEYLVRMHKDGTTAMVDNNYNLGEAANNVYFLNIRIPVKYVGGGGGS